MRTLLFIFILLALVSCKTSKPNSSIFTEHDSVYVEIDKLIPVVNPADSAAIRALLECDENGRVVLRWLDMANTKNVQLQFQLDSMGKLVANFQVPPDTIYIPMKETSVSSSKKKTETKIIEVEKVLSKWQHFCIWFTTITLIVTGIGLIIFIRRKFKK